MEQVYEQRRTMTETSDPRDEDLRARVLEALRHFGEKTLTYSGEQPGPSLLIIGGTHGNEILGVLVADMLRESLENKTLVLKAGTVRLLLGNPRAIEADERTAPGGSDLNRIFLPEVLEGREERGWEGRRARRVAKDIRASDIVIDLHSTNKPSPAFVCAAETSAHQAIYKWLPRESVVFDPERVISGGGGSIDEAADDFGKIGICYESGQAVDTRNLIPVFEAICAILIEQGMVDGTLPELPRSGDEYTAVTSIPYDKDREFVFAEGKDRGFAPVREGEVIGYRDGEPVVSPFEGVILFPKKPEHQENAGLVCYLAVKK